MVGGELFVHEGVGSPKFSAVYPPLFSGCFCLMMSASMVTPM